MYALYPHYVCFSHGPSHTPLTFRKAVLPRRRESGHDADRDRRRLREIAQRRACRIGCECFRESEVEHLHRDVGPHLDVRRFEIAVNDPLSVRRFKRVRYLLRDRQQLD
jgi:hypothetical protein